MLGTVATLRRYPVKSMLGEDLKTSDVSRTGLAGDRRLAVVSRRTGKVASAKYPRLWRDLLTLSAKALPAGASSAGNQDAAGHEVAALITLPDGKTLSSTDADADDVLSRLLNEPDRIAELSPYRRTHLERYRPNVVIGTEAGGFTENDWLGRDLRIGDELVLRVIARTPRCAVPTLAHGHLPRHAEALRVLARHNRVSPLPDSDPEPCAGVYAQVLRPGRISTGDPVRWH